MADRYDSGLDDLTQHVYEKAMADRYANTRVGKGKNDYGYTARVGSYGRANKGTGGINFPFGGRGSYAGFSEDDLKRLLKYDKMVWERSTPDVTGVGGQVRWDRDKNMVTSTLSPENQAIYDAMKERQLMFGEQATNMASGGWEDAQQKRFDQKRALYAGEDAREAAIRRERQYATGASTTGMFAEDARVAANLNQRNMLLEEAAFNESQGLIDSAQRRQGLDIDSMRTLGEVANSMIRMPTPNTQGNMEYVSKASTRWADALAMDALKKQQGKSKFWNSILGGISGGMFT